MLEQFTEAKSCSLFEEIPTSQNLVKLPLRTRNPRETNLCEANPYFTKPCEISQTLLRLTLVKPTHISQNLVKRRGGFTNPRETNPCLLTKIIVRIWAFSCPSEALAVALDVADDVIHL